MALLLPLILAAEAPAKPVVPLASTPELGKAEGKCRPGERPGVPCRCGRIKGPHRQAEAGSLSQQ
jgi:hypothetical protein